MLRQTPAGSNQITSIPDRSGGAGNKDTVTHGACGWCRLGWRNWQQAAARWRAEGE